MLWDHGVASLRADRRPQTTPESVTRGDARGGQETAAALEAEIAEFNQHLAALDRVVRDYTAWRDRRAARGHAPLVHPAR